MRYKIIPIDFKTANTFVNQFHRHNKKVSRYKFCIGLEEEGELIGVAIAGRPIARLLNNGKTLEILRVCVKENKPNASSMLYGRARRIAEMMGYEKIITYTLQRESQSSMKAIGARLEKKVLPQEWDRPNRRRLSQKVYREPKFRWSL